MCVVRSSWFALYRRSAPALYGAQIYATPENSQSFEPKSPMLNTLIFSLRALVPRYVTGNWAGIARRIAVIICLWTLLYHC